MHELAISQAVLSLVCDIARQHGGVARKVVLRIGPLSGVEPDLLARAFPIAAAGSEAEGAVLEIERAGVVVRCMGCGKTSDAVVNNLMCAACGDWRTELLSGDEMILSRVELVQLSSVEAAAEVSHV